jgi:hypothetical protein
MKTQDKIFLFAFFLLNLLQATFTELTGDEALYWMHWQNLDWGFRDHPPMTAVMIGIGYSIIQSELGVRLLMVISNAILLVLIYRLVKPNKSIHYIALVLSIPFFTLYGFMATPDVSLLLATAFYLTVWKKFLDEQNNRNTLLLALAFAALMWSKYHGAFIILFTLLPIRKIWFSKHYWVAGVMGIVLYSPHIIWQITHDLPTIKFHLNDRNSDAMELKHILGYVGGQFAVFNPIVFIAAIVIMIRVKAQNSFEQSIRWMISGMLLFFLFDSFRGRVEIHWTAPLCIPVFYLLITRWNEIVPKKSLLAGLFVFAFIMLLGRIALIVDFVPQLYKEFHRDKQKMAAIKQLAGNSPVCFMNSYQNPSLYMFYSGGIAHAINNIEGGKNQYDYWNYNEYIHKKPFLFVASYEASGFGKDTVGRFVFDTKKYADLPVMHGLKIRTDEWLHHYHVGDTARIAASIMNTNRYALQLKNDMHSIRWKAMFNHKKHNEANPDLFVVNLPDALAAGETARIELKFVIPEIRGKNYLLFATQVDELPHTYQSNKLRVMID